MDSQRRNPPVCPIDPLATRLAKVTNNGPEAVRTLYVRQGGERVDSAEEILSEHFVCEEINTEEYEQFLRVLRGG